MTDRESESGLLDRLEAPAGLCAECLHRRLVRSRRSVFVRCGLADRDDRFPRYPRLPVLSCAGFAPRGGAAGEGGESGSAADERLAEGLDEEDRRR